MQDPAQARRCGWHRRGEGILRIELFDQGGRGVGKGGWWWLSGRCGALRAGWYPEHGESQKHHHDKGHIRIERSLHEHYPPGPWPGHTPTLSEGRGYRLG